MNTRLAPGLAWPVDARTLRTALGEASASVEVKWLFWVKQPSDRPFEVTWGPLDGDELRPGLLVTVQPIARDDLQTFRSGAQTEILDALAQWCRRALEAPAGWRLMRHDRRWTVRGNTVKSAERSGVDAQPWQW